MNITNQTKVGEIVALDINLAKILNDYEIDFCCGGERLLFDICREKNISFEEVVAALLSNSGSLSTAGLQFDNWSLDLLIDYIVKYHHHYIRTQGPKTFKLLQKVAEVHGETNPKLIEIYELFQASLVDLHEHLDKEEMVLFPFIEELLKTERENLQLPNFHCGSIENPIGVMLHEHSNEGDRFRQIAALSDNYSAPQYACDSYRLVMQLLQEFENNLHLHIHVENNILFLKSIALQEKLS